MKRTAAPKPPYTHLSIDKLVFESKGHEIHFFGYLTTSKDSFQQGDVYRGKWDDIPDGLFEQLELEKIEPLRQYVLIYNPNSLFDT